MTLEKYTLKVKQPEYWQEIHDTLCGVSSCQHIPDREVSCTDEKEHSATRGTFSLHASEVEELKNHPYIDWIELCPTCNPDSYPKPRPATKRFKKDVKVYRTLDGSTISVSPTSSELNRTNWAIARVGVRTAYEIWGSDVGNINPINSDFSYSLTGKNVDIVIQDTGVLQYHPEFLDANGQSRVRDIVLDGPYYIDPDYFNDNGYTYTKSDGRTGITTASAESWWENGANRSPQFSSIGTVIIPSTYTVNRSLGDSLDGSNGMTSDHGTACAGLAAGKNFGLAFEANIWNMPAIRGNVGMNVEASYDLIKLFHKYKPINPTTGVKNPTIVNGSWGYGAGFDRTDTVGYKFRGSTGTFIGDAPVTDQVTAMKHGLDTGQLSYREWSTSSRSNSIDTAGNELMAEGVIYVAAAGNENQRLGIGADDPDRLNYMEDYLSGIGDPRTEFGGLKCPCNHRDWMNPNGIGFDESKDFHPVVCVGAMDDYMYFGSIERKASYSNNGPGVDVWAPADSTLSAGFPSLISYQRYDDNRFHDRYFNGTSAAAPVVTGLVALYLESNPKATSRDVKNWIKNRASNLLTSEYYDQYPDDTTTTYWTGDYNMRGAEKRILYNPYANDIRPSFETRENIVTEGLSLHLDARSGFETDLSGNSNIPSMSGNVYDGESYQLTLDSINTLSGTNLNLTGGQFTLESWVYYGGNSLDGGSYGQIFTQDTGSALGGQGWQWRVSNSNKQIEFIYWTSSSRSSAVGFSYSTPLVAGNWYHLVVSYDGTNIKGYINGSLDVTHTPSSALYGSTATIGIGGFSSLQYGDILNGKIAVIRGYKNYYLSDKQIQSNYINQKGRFFGQGSFSIDTRENIVTDGLVNYLNAANKNSYPGSGTTWYDLSGNNRNGTISGSYSDGSLFFNPGYVNFSQYNFGNEFTFIAFINPTTASTISALFANSSAGSTTNGIRIFINFENSNSRTLHIELGNGSSSQLITSASNTVTYGVWQQVAFTLNKSTAKGAIYYNGIKVKENNLNFTNFNSNAAFNFGTIGGAYTYVGRLSNFMTYNRVLTPKEIRKNYIQGYSTSTLSIF